MSSAPTRAFVVWPSAPLTDGLVRKALGALQPCPEILDSVPESFAKLILWSAYDSIDHELTHDHPSTVLSCAYTIRKSLIRKHFLARTIQNYLVKHPDSILKTSVPRTWDLEISFADELDEKWSDELYDLADELEHGDKWWILKPGMADRGMGIRLFNSKDALEQIFVEFEGDSDEEDEEKAGDTAVVTSQLRHFVIQEYLSTPLLLDPRQVPLDTSMPPVDVADVRGYKFHLRVYCIASGALEVYLYTRILALFSPVPFETPRASEVKETDDALAGASSTVDLTPHLTNTCLQLDRGEEGVRLLSELVGCQIMSTSEGTELGTLTNEHVEAIIAQIGDVLAETFRAALQTPVHFQPLPNAWELFGVDFCVELSQDGQASPFVQLLEFNAEPAIENTGSRLTWILEDLFAGIGKVCVQPFLSRGRVDSDQQEPSEADMQDGGRWLEEQCALRKVLSTEVRGSGGW